MIVQFSIKNYRSIKAEIVISMLAGANTELENELIVIDGKKQHRLVRVASIYGANAAGKSNVLLAMQTLQDMVMGKSAQLLKDKPLPYDPFAFDDNGPQTPTEFGVIYYYNGIKYEYSFAYNQERIVSESLYHWPNGREAEIFSREGYAYSFKENQKEQQTLAGRTPNNRLYLVSSNEWNSPQTELAYKWFTEKLTPFDSHAKTDATITLLKDKTSNYPSLVRIIRAFLQADLGIVDFSIVDPSGTPSVWVTHQSKNDKGERRFELPLEQESTGTQRFFARIGPWLNALEKGGILFVDELEGSMHPLLTRQLIRMIQDPEINTNNAQLIFTTHDVTLLDLSLLRRDQIWFAEKDPDTLGTDIFSMWDFSVRKDENIQRGYLLGKYGAIPFIGGDL